MKITPMASFAATNVQQAQPQAQVPQNAEPMRSIRVVTNHTPQQNQVMDGNPQKLSIQNNNEAPVVEATQQMDPQLARLAKYKRSLQIKEKALVDREKALESMGQQSQGIAIDRLKSEPLKVLLENGVTYEQLTEAILSNQSNSEMYALKKEMETFKQGVDKRFVDQNTQAEQQVLAEMRRDANRLAAQSTDFELVRETRSVPTVMKLIEKTYRSTGEVLDVREAMGLVEGELFKDTQRILKLQKIQSQFSPQVSTQQRPSGMRTLTNRDTASVPLSAKQRAMAAFYGNYKR